MTRVLGLDITRAVAITGMAGYHALEGFDFSYVLHRPQLWGLAAVAPYAESRGLFFQVSGASRAYGAYRSSPKPLGILHQLGSGLVGWLVASALDIVHQLSLWAAENALRRLQHQPLSNVPLTPRSTPLSGAVLAGLAAAALTGLVGHLCRKAPSYKVKTLLTVVFLVVLAFVTQLLSPLAHNLAFLVVQSMHNSSACNHTGVNSAAWKTVSVVLKESTCFSLHEDHLSSFKVLWFPIGWILSSLAGQNAGLFVFLPDTLVGAAFGVFLAFAAKQHERGNGISHHEFLASSTLFYVLLVVLSTVLLLFSGVFGLFSAPKFIRETLSGEGVNHAQVGHFLYVLWETLSFVSLTLVTTLPRRARRRVSSCAGSTWHGPAVPRFRLLSVFSATIYFVDPWIRVLVAFVPRLLNVDGCGEGLFWYRFREAYGQGYYPDSMRIGTLMQLFKTPNASLLSSGACIGYDSLIIMGVVAGACYTGLIYVLNNTKLVTLSPDHLLASLSSRIAGHATPDIRSHAYAMDTQLIRVDENDPCNTCTGTCTCTCTDVEHLL